MMNAEHGMHHRCNASEDEAQPNDNWDAYWEHVRKAVEASILRDKRGTRLRGVQRFKTPNKVLLRRRQR